MYTYVILYVSYIKVYIDVYVYIYIYMIYIIYIYILYTVYTYLYIYKYVLIPKMCLKRNTKYEVNISIFIYK